MSSPRPDPSQVGSSYAALREHCAVAGAPVIAMDHLRDGETGPTDPASSMARLRRTVLNGLATSFHRVEEAPGRSVGVVLVSGVARGGQFLPAVLGTGPAAVDLAIDALRTNPRTAGLRPDQFGPVHQLMPDAVLTAVFDVVVEVDPAGPDHRRLFVNAMCADGSAVQLQVDGSPAAPQAHQAVSTDPVAGTTAAIVADPLTSPGFPSLAAVLRAALPSTGAPAPAPPGPRTTAEDLGADAVRLFVDGALRQAWADVHENEHGALVVRGWARTACQIEVLGIDEGRLVVDIRGLVTHDVVPTPDLYDHVARSSTLTPLASLGITGTGRVQLAFEHTLLARDLTAQNLRAVVRRLGDVADAHALLLRARFGGSLFV